jgi:hypothetical protein
LSLLPVIHPPGYEILFAVGVRHFGEDIGSRRRDRASGNAGFHVADLVKRLKRVSYS